MKSNEEVLAYLQPYTEMEGISQKTKVTIERVRKIDLDYMVVSVDVMSAWRNPHNYNDKGKGESIKSYLRRNGFEYVSLWGHYHRPYNQKYWSKDTNRIKALNNFFSSLQK
jgi:hypothetical protein